VAAACGCVFDWCVLVEESADDTFELDRIVEHHVVVSVWNLYHLCVGSNGHHCCQRGVRKKRAVGPTDEQERAAELVQGRSEVLRLGVGQRLTVELRRPAAIRQLSDGVRSDPGEHLRRGVRLGRQQAKAAERLFAVGVDRMREVVQAVDVACTGRADPGLGIDDDQAVETFRNEARVCDRDDTAKGVTDEVDTMRRRGVDEGSEIADVVLDPIRRWIRTLTVSMATQVERQDVVGVGNGVGKPVPPVRVRRAAVEQHHGRCTRVPPFQVMQTKTVQREESITSAHVWCLPCAPRFATAGAGSVRPGMQTLR
jgi:hypothetical protein